MNEMSGSTDSSVSDHPREAQEEHNTPNVEQTPDEHTLDPSELISLALDFIAVSSGLQDQTK